MMNSYSLAERINSEVNSSVTYKTDLAQYAMPEYWECAGKYGDCEDYALLKRALLLAHGFDADKINIVICSCNGVGHCVLMVETDKGCFILDNNYNEPMPPSKLPYIWDKVLRGSEWYALSFA